MNTFLHPLKLIYVIYVFGSLYLTFGAFANGYAFQVSSDSVHRSPYWSFSNSGQTLGFYMIASGNLEPRNERHELLVTEPFYDNGIGRVYYFSGLNDTIPDLIFPNPRGNDIPTLFGASIAIGDINNDGLEDVLIGERTNPKGISSAVSGQVYIYFGRSESKTLNTLPDVTITNPGKKIEGAEDNFGDHVHIVSGDTFGMSTSNLQVKGKTIRFFIGARNQDNGTPGEHSHGAIYAYDEHGTLIWSVIGNKNEYLGKWIETADIDNSGSLDLLVGGAVPTNVEPSPSGGVVRIWPTGSDGTLDLTSLSFMLPHPETFLGGKNQNFGYRLTPGDLTGDGIIDLLVSDPYANDYNSAVYLYEGPLGPNDRPVWIMHGKKDERHDELPKLRSLDFGDINNDGIDDLLIGAPTRALWSGNARVYVIFGGRISELPGEGNNPRIAYDYDIGLKFGSPGTGTFGENGVLAPLIGSPINSEEVVITVLNSGDKKNLKVYVFSLDIEGLEN